jgi:hypothetical protein
LGQSANDYRSDIAASIALLRRTANDGCGKVLHTSAEVVALNP